MQVRPIKLEFCQLLVFDKYQFWMQILTTNLPSGLLISMVLNSCLQIQYFELLHWIENH